MQLRLLLREIFTAAGGSHDDWDTYNQVMARERRAAVLLTPDPFSPTRPVKILFIPLPLGARADHRAALTRVLARVLGGVLARGAKLR